MMAGRKCFVIIVTSSSYFQNLSHLTCSDKELISKALVGILEVQGCSCKQSNTIHPCVGLSMDRVFLTHCGLCKLILL
jgi:hypothetical protein